MAERVVVVTRYIPYPASTGALIYTAQLVQMWAALAGGVDVFCAKQPGPPRAVQQPSEQNVVYHIGESIDVDALRYALNTEPKSASSFATPGNRRRLTDLLNAARPNIVVIDHIGATWSLPVVSEYQAHSSHNVSLVYSTHNDEVAVRLSIARESGFPTALPHLVDAARLYLRDRNALRSAMLVTGITSADCEAYKRRGAAEILVIPPIYTGDVVARRTITTSTPRKIVIVGSFLWSAKMLNLRVFLKVAWPSIAASGVIFEVVGRMREEDRVALSRDYPAIRFHGEVEEIEPLLTDVRLGLLIDKAGGGFKMTSLTYAFNKIPVAALESAIADEHLRDSCIVANSFSALIREAIAVIDDIARLNRLQERLYSNAKRYLDGAQPLNELKAWVASHANTDGMEC